MGLLSGILGMASEVDSNQMESELQEILIDDEIIRNGFKLIRDLVVFTNKRLILIDKQGWTGKKKNIYASPSGALITSPKKPRGRLISMQKSKFGLKAGMNLFLWNSGRTHISIRFSESSVNLS